VTTADVVAIKIIDVDESDIANPRNTDSYSEFLKEISALKLMRENKARNINHVIEALSVGKTMWIITDYCGGGSVATLVCLSPNLLIFDAILLRELTKR
jgi:serine/threonine protein kinase